MLPDPAAFNKTRKRRENILIFLLSLILLTIASGALWYLLAQPYGKARDQASTQVSPSPNGLLSRAPLAKQSAPLPQPSPPAAPATQEAAPQTQPAPSTAQPRKQATSQPQLASPAAPATRPTAAVREPEMNMLRGGSFIMGSNDDVTEKPTHQVTIKPFAIGRYPISVREWNESLPRRHVRSRQPAKMTRPSRT